MASAVPVPNISGASTATTGSEPHFRTPIQNLDGHCVTRALWFQLCPLLAPLVRTYATLRPVFISTFVLFPFESRQSILARTTALQNQKLEQSVPVCSPAPHYPCFVRKTYPEVVVLLPPRRPLHGRLCCAGSNPQR